MSNLLGFVPVWTGTGHVAGVSPPLRSFWGPAAGEGWMSPVTHISRPSSSGEQVGETCKWCGCWEETSSAKFICSSWCKKEKKYSLSCFENASCFSVWILNLSCAFRGMWTPKGEWWQSQPLLCWFNSAAPFSHSKS